MRRQLLTNVLSSVLICTSLTLSSYSSHAATARQSLTKLSSEGFRTCHSGNNGWTGLVRGDTLDGNVAGVRGFSLRYCFGSKGQCQQFISNIQSIVSNVDSIRLRKCSPR